MTKVILVDNDDNVLGYEEKELCHTGDGKHHRAIALFLFNENGETLLQRRKHKRWDDVWDIAGATDVWVINGREETYEECGNRCIEREWGVTTNLKQEGGFNYFQKYENMCENEFCMILSGTVDSGSVKPNPDVAYDHKWISMEDLAREIEENPNEYTPWAIIAVREWTKRNK